MNSPRVDAASGVVDGRVYVAGGIMKTFMDEVECYDSGSMRWMHVSPIIANRSRLAGCVLNNVLYVAGGCDRDSYYNLVERYNDVHSRIVSNDFIDMIQGLVAGVLLLPCYNFAKDHQLQCCMIVYMLLEDSLMVFLILFVNVMIHVPIDGSTYSHWN